MWRFFPFGRFYLPCKKVPMQELSYIWPLYQLVLYERSTKTSIPSRTRKPKAHQLTASIIQAYESQSDSEGSNNSFCLQVQIKCVQAQNKVDRRPPCLITNLPYRLKMHKNRNVYLHARLDTCADMSTSCQHLYTS